MPMGFKGRVAPPNLAHLIQLSQQRHQQRLALIAKMDLPPTWDSRDKGWLGPIKDQSQCGSCWDFSGVGICEIAFIKAGILTASQALSEQYILSCQRSGGCNGDDNTTVLQVAKATGLPLTSDYGPYTARSGSCTYKPSMPLFKVDDWGFADANGGQGVTPVPEIKAAIIAYGCVGCAVAAGGSQFWNDGQGVGTGTSRGIDHDVILVGWDDSKGPHGAWIMRNSWGSGWGTGGYAWIAYGADQIGTEAVFAQVKNPNPPPGPVDWGQF